MSSEIKAVIFDVMGVLYLRKPVYKSKSTHLEMAKLLKMDLDSWIDHIDKAYPDSMAGKISDKEAYDSLALAFEMSKKKLFSIWEGVYKRFYRKNEVLFDFALRLKNDYKIGVLSDQWALSKKVFMSKSVFKGFNPVLISCEVGLRKPNKEIYKLLLNKLRLPARNVLFIDNREYNLKPARELGIKTILFENNDSFFEDFREMVKYK